MRRVLASCLILSFLLAPLPAFAAASKPIAKATHLTALLRTERGSCSTWPVSPREYITAAHCVEAIGDHATVFVKSDLRVIGEVKALDAEKDLALLYVGMAPDYLKVSMMEPTFGDDVWMIGYPAGISNSTYFPASLMGVMILDEYGPKLFFNHGLVGGMSGGPIVNHKGEVISVNQLGNTWAGLGVLTSELRVFANEHVKHL